MNDIITQAKAFARATTCELDVDESQAYVDDERANIANGSGSSKPSSDEDEMGLYNESVGTDEVSYLIFSYHILDSCIARLSRNIYEIA